MDKDPGSASLLLCRLDVPSLDSSPASVWGSVWCRPIVSGQECCRVEFFSAD